MLQIIAPSLLLYLSTASVCPGINIPLHFGTPFVCVHSAAAGQSSS